jgi:uncharacterized membrane protein (DUF106 family)
MAFENFLNPVFSPLLNFPPFVSVFIVSLIISVIIVVVYKYTTNQKLMKDLKDQMKEMQNEMKLLKNEPDKMMKVQGKVMETNMKYMTHSFRATLFTFLPIIIIFAWMNAHYAYEPLYPNEPFQMILSFEKNSVGNVSLTLPDGMSAVGSLNQQISADKVIFILKGKEGIYDKNNSLKVDYGDSIFYKDIIITNEMKYSAKDTPIKNSNLKMISMDYKKKVILPYLNWGWLGTYILLSIGFSMGLRKWLNVY